MTAQGPIVKSSRPFVPTVRAPPTVTVAFEAIVTSPATVAPPAVKVVDCAMAT